MPRIGHRQTRNRGTLGVSLANADPSADIPLVATARQAEIELRGPGGTRRLAAGDFLLGAMDTALRPGELLVAARFPVWRGRVGAAVEEIAARQSDFAIVAAAAQLALDEDGVCRRAALALAGASPCAVRSDAADAALVGSRLDQAAIHAAWRALEPLLAPSGDVQADAAYRLRVAPEILARAVRRAARP